MVGINASETVALQIRPVLVIAGTIIISGKRVDQDPNFVLLSVAKSVFLVGTSAAIRLLGCGATPTSGLLQRMSDLAWTPLRVVERRLLITKLAAIGLLDSQPASPMHHLLE